MIVNILRFLCKVLFRVKVIGDANVPLHKKVLVIANHQSFLDGLLIGLFLPFRATFVVHSASAKYWLFRPFLALVDYLPVDPTSPMAMKKVIKLLETGTPVVIFPEGRITLTGSLMKIYEGPSFVAAKTGATILPVHIEGAAHSYFSRLTDGHPRKLFPEVTLSMLPTTKIEMPVAPSAKERRRLSGECMRRMMQEMLFSTKRTETIFDAFLDAVAFHGRKTPLVEDMQQIEENYGTLLKKSLALGRLVEKISAPDENVGVLMPNVIATICLVYGMAAMRRIPAMLNYTAGAEGIKNACIVAGVSTIITSHKFLENANLVEVVTNLKT